MEVYEDWAGMRTTDHDTVKSLKDPCPLCKSKLIEEERVSSGDCLIEIIASCEKCDVGWFIGERTYSNPEKSPETDENGEMYF